MPLLSERNETNRKLFFQRADEILKEMKEAAHLDSELSQSKTLYNKVCMIGGYLVWHSEEAWVSNSNLLKDSLEDLVSHCGQLLEVLKPETNVKEEEPSSPSYDPIQPFIYTITDPYPCTSPSNCAITDMFTE